MSLADRIAVMFNGKFLKIVETEQISREEIGLLMTGAVYDSSGDYSHRHPA